MKTRHLGETSSTQSALQVIVNIWSLFKGFPSLCFPTHKHLLPRCVSQSVRLLLSVRWRLTEADTSCKQSGGNRGQKARGKLVAGGGGVCNWREWLMGEFQDISGLFTKNVSVELWCFLLGFCPQVMSGWFFGKLMSQLMPCVLPEYSLILVMFEMLLCIQVQFKDWQFRSAVFKLLVVWESWRWGDGATESSEMASRCWCLIQQEVWPVSMVNSSWLDLPFPSMSSTPNKHPLIYSGIRNKDGTFSSRTCLWFITFLGVLQNQSNSEIFVSMCMDKLQKGITFNGAN